MRKSSYTLFFLPYFIVMSDFFTIFAKYLQSNLQDKLTFLFSLKILLV